MAVPAHSLVGLWSIFTGGLLMFPNPRLGFVALMRAAGLRTRPAARASALS